jgi:hypothetical protein
MPQSNDLPAGREGRVFGVPRRREQIVALLSEAYARNDLEQAEFERRLERAEGARTIEELEALVADFPSDATERSAGRSPSEGSAAMSGKDLEREISNLDGMAAPTRFNLLGDLHVSVMPSEPRVLRAVSVLGDTKVDLRGLSGLPGAFLLKVATLLGDTKIYVPRGTKVVTHLFSLIGGQSQGRKNTGFLARIAKGLGGVLGKTEEPPRPPGPTVVVTGFKVLGNTKVIED